MKGLKLWEVLKAFDEGKKVQIYHNDKWLITGIDIPDIIISNLKAGIIYRIKPEVEVREYFGTIQDGELIFCYDTTDITDTHKITIEFENNEPICSSIRMEKI